MGLAFRQFVFRIKSMVPKNLKDRVRHILVKRHSKTKKNVHASVALADIEKGLRKIGIGEGDIIFVHSSADKLNAVEGGPMKILNLLVSIIGKEGTLVMPTFPFDGMAADYLDKNRKFDVRRTASKVGLISELFRRTPGVFRSIHPTHPVCAMGRHAEYFTSEHHLDTRPFGERSPFRKMEEKKAKILMIGVDSTYLTHAHVVEDILGDKYPYKIYKDDLKEIEITDKDGNVSLMHTFVHNPDVTRFKRITEFEKEWIKLGVLQKENVDHISLRVIDAVQLSDTMVKWALKGKTIYG